MKSFMMSLVLAFSTYTRIPMPKVAWDEQDKLDPLPFFPLIGLVLAFAFVLIYELARPLGLIFQTAMLCCVPILLTGGIHLDGFLDVADALASYQNKERRLEILKDPHVGAFAVIHVALYFLLQLGFYSTISQASLPLFAIGFVVSRSLIVLLTLFTPNARNSGMLYTMQSTQQKAANIASATIALGPVFLFSFRFGFLTVLLGFLSVCSAALILRQKMIVHFGGITGDLAGYSLQVLELIWAFSVMILMRYLT